LLRERRREHIKGTTAAESILITLQMGDERAAISVEKNLYVL
jgi:hypothetical protein